MPRNGPAAQSSHGDAQSDILGGASIIMMVLFLGLAALLTVTLVMIQSANSAAKVATQRADTAEEALSVLAGRKLTPQELQLLLSAKELKEEIERKKKEIAAAKKKLSTAKARYKKEISAVKAELRKAKARAQKKGVENVNLRSEIAQLKRKNKGLHKRLNDSDKPVNIVSNGMMLWIQGKTALITEEDTHQYKGRNYWRHKYKCRRNKGRTRAAEPGEAGDGSQGYHIGR